MKKYCSNRNFPESKRTISRADDTIVFTVFCDDHDEVIRVPYHASSDEVASNIRKSLGVRGSFFLLLKTDDGGTVRSGPRQNVYFHCSSIKASVLANYKEFAWEIRGSRYQKGGDSLWYYQSQRLKAEVLRRMEEDEWEPIDFPP